MSQVRITFPANPSSDATTTGTLAICPGSAIVTIESVDVSESPFNAGGTIAGATPVPTRLIGGAAGLELLVKTMVPRAVPATIGENVT